MGTCATKRLRNEKLVGEDVTHNAHAEIDPGFEVDVYVGAEGHVEVAAMT